MKYRFLYLTVFLLFLPARGAVAETLLIIGDSLSAAYGIPVETGWVALLQQQLAAEHPAWDIVNASISGDTTANARARMPQALDMHQPDIVVLELGGNDGLRGLSLDAMRDNLAAMIELAQAQHAGILLVGVDLPPNYGPRYTEKFRAVYRSLATDYRVTLLPSLLDGVGTHTDLMQADGIHPNGKAQAQIAARVMEYLEPLFSRQRITAE
ncbi:MAG: arylesterase [Gammaproteobacteria bacterium]|jgi:acyl-CoA thioesterase-1